MGQIDEWFPPLSCGLPPPPLSLSLPTPHDIQRNNKLIHYLANQQAFDTKDDDKKNTALQILKQIVEEWIVKVAKRHTKKDTIINKAHAKVYVIGSFALNVSGKESDIDAICIGPSYANRKIDFFKHFYNMLVASEDVTDIISLSTILVPIIKFKINGVSFDLSYSKLKTHLIINNERQLDPNTENLSSYFENDDGESERSLRGWITYHRFLSLFPTKLQETDIRPLSNFRSTLRCIKLWAKQRGINSNILGMLGGINCAILVAKICTLFPRALPYKLVCYFFQLYSQWKWPTPVMLYPIQGGLGRNREAFGWDPRQDIRDKRQAMPIIIPVHPFPNSCYRVTRGTLKRMGEEFIRAHRTCQRWEDDPHWKCEDLFSPSTRFEDQFDYFLVLTIVASNNTDLDAWRSYVVSTLTGKLCIPIENMCADFLICHPHAVQYIDKAEKNEHHVIYLIGLRGPDNQNFERTKGSVQGKVDNFVNQIKATPPTIMNKKQGMEATIKIAAKADLHSLVSRENGRRKITTSRLEVRDDGDDDENINIINAAAKAKAKGKGKEIVEECIIKSQQVISSDADQNEKHNQPSHSVTTATEDTNSTNGKKIVEESAGPTKSQKSSALLSSKREIGKENVKKFASPRNSPDSSDRVPLALKPSEVPQSEKTKDANNMSPSARERSNKRKFDALADKKNNKKKHVR